MKLHLLENRHAGVYTTFGSCWTKGEVVHDNFRLVNHTGDELPVQTEIAARWPDGSVKWARHTADARTMGKAIEILPGEPAAMEKAISIAETETGWQIDAGRITLTVCKPGSDVLAEGVTLDGVLRIRRIEPIFLLERRAQQPDGVDIRVRRTCTRVQDVTIESAGPLECVVKYTGYYEDREKLMPFVIRLYVGLDADDIRFDHTFIFSGVEERDFLKGMGLRFMTPLAGAAYNHHAKFVTEWGVFHEPAVLMESRIPRTGPAMKIRQLAGENLLFEEGTSEAEVAVHVSSDVPMWNKYALTQLTADSYSLRKRTKPGRCMVDIRVGRRAPGAMAVSGENGGVMLSLRDFWQRFPSGLEVENLGGEQAECTVWFHSPEAEAYDFRHYDDRSYPESNYEGFKEYGASADGIATTSQCRIGLINACPSDETLQQFCRATQKPAVYVASPETYHAKRAFGYWSLLCEATEAERSLEKLMASAIDFYQQQIEQRSWYGLFNYGDFMHSYDEYRNTWKYDIGGCAWQNTELVPTYWLWLCFMRTGREDVFSLAEAMSRHTSETDLYHFGPMKGMGSRHNVRHWGCSCKEPRVSMAGHHRPMFYLTGDRRLGDVFDDVKDAAESLPNLYSFYDHTFPRPVLTTRSGPDWPAYLSNWMTQHERTLDPRYLDKIENGINSIAQAPMRLGSGPAFEMNPYTGHMGYIGESTPNIHLTLCMGGPQIWMETADAIDSELLRDMLDEYGRVYLMTDEERKTAYGDLVEGKKYGMNYVSAALSAWSARRTEDAELARRAWETLLLASPARYNPEGFVGDVYATTDEGVELTGLSWNSTNYASQWCLNVMVTLDFIREHLPSLDEAKRLAAIPMNIGK